MVGWASLQAGSENEKWEGGREYEQRRKSDKPHKVVERQNTLSSENKPIYLYCGSVWYLKRDRERISGENIFLGENNTPSLVLCSPHPLSLPASHSSWSFAACKSSTTLLWYLSMGDGQSRAAQHNLNAMQSR